MSVGMPEDLLLHEFGSLLMDVFGHEAYHVGSSLKRKRGWRDVDVRVMLPDDEWAAMGLGDPDHPHRNAKWRGLVLAFTALGRKMTGLPIDFQIQQMSHANKNDDDRRSALVVVPHRFAKEKPCPPRPECGLKHDPSHHTRLKPEPKCASCGLKKFFPKDPCPACSGGKP